MSLKNKTPAMGPAKKWQNNVARRYSRASAAGYLLATAVVRSVQCAAQPGHWQGSLDNVWINLHRSLAVLEDML